MAKGVSKRYYHKQDMDKVNRTAIVIGASVAGVILITMIISFLN